MAPRREDIEDITERGAEFRLPHVKEEHRADRDASFEREALPWLDSVYRYARSLCHDSDDAEDIVQETFLRAFRSWHSFQPGSDCRRWLFAICRNAFLRALRCDHRERRLPADGSIRALDRHADHEMLRPDEGERIIDQLDLVPALSAAIDRLPEPYRSTVILVDVEDQSYEAAAAIAQVPIGTVRSRLFRGRRILQRMLLAYASDRGYAAAS
jgi:RNA polymerase sigma-70 factor (ECF subfamily)